MGLTRKKILETSIVIKEVDTPEWGGVTYIRMIPIKEHFEFSEKNTDPEENAVKVGDFIIRYLLLAISDEKGNRLFLDEDEDELSKKSPIVLLRIYEEAKKLNGDNIEDLEKNLETTQGEDSALD